MTNRSRAHQRPNPVQIDRARRDATPGHVGGVPAIDSHLVMRAAQSNCTLLITGETGVGKGYLARWIHEHSARRNGPFIPVNCGAIPETLVDSQLFGHVRGAFSGATEHHVGLVRAANGGSLLLDEVSELPPSAQNRLLRLLQDHEVQPVGHPRPIVVDVRIIAATNIDLRRAVSERRFREDLLFRLDVIQLNVPPLRNRIGELSDLIRTFNGELALLYRQQELDFTPEALEFLHSYPWPGNIRQVRTLIERLHVLCPGESITMDHLLRLGQLDYAPGTMASMQAIENARQQQLKKILDDAGGSIAKAAESFGVHRSTIYRWLRR